MCMINLFEISYVNWIDYINSVFQFDWSSGVKQDDLYVACRYFYFG